MPGFTSREWQAGMYPRLYFPYILIKIVSSLITRKARVDNKVYIDAHLFKKQMLFGNFLYTSISRILCKQIFKCLANESKYCHLFYSCVILKQNKYKKKWNVMTLTRRGSNFTFFAEPIE